MPMGILSDEDFEKELERVQIVPIERGRGHSPAVPDSLRKIIGENAIEEGSKETKVMTRALGISDSALAAYKVGATSTSSYHNPTFKDHIDKARQRVVKRARHTMVSALKEITPEKLKDEKPRDLAGIAKDMSVIIRNMEPSSQDSNGQAPLIIFAPQIVSEEKFEVIDAQLE